MNNTTKRHLGNISRLVGHDVSNKYSYIISESDLINAWVKMHNDLGYPLMIDSKYRRSIVYNKQGLERQINNMIVECIKEATKDLTDIVVADIISQINSITQTTSGKVISKNNSYTGKTNLFIPGANDLETWANKNGMQYLLDEWSPKNKKLPKETPR